MRALRILSAFFILLALIIIVGSFFIPSTFHYSYTGDVKATPEQVYEQVNELKNWEHWSYWNRMDTAMHVEFSTPSSGINAYYTWTSQNKDVGSGKLTITESIPYSVVKTHLDFEEWGGGDADYYIKKTATGTQLTCAFRSEMKGVFYKWVGLLIMKSQMRTAYKSCVDEMNKHLNP